MSKLGVGSGKITKQKNVDTILTEAHTSVDMGSMKKLFLWGAIGQIFCINCQPPHQNKIYFVA
jgi:hypothetical protein